MFYCFLITLDGFFSFVLILVDIGKIVVGIAVARIDLYGFLVPVDSLVQLLFSFVDNSHVVVGTVVLRVSSYALHVVFKSFFVLSLVVIGDPNGVMNLIDVFV